MRSIVAAIVTIGMLGSACAGVLCAPADAAQASASISDRTVIHPADQLSVQVFGDQALSQNATVLADGTIDYPLIGRVRVGGKTPDEAAALLTSRLHEYVRHPFVTVTISQLGQIDVLVLGGDVKSPGKYSLRSDARVTDALAAAGGLANTDGAFPEARISDGAGNVASISLMDLLQHGDTALDHPLGEGSVVYVPGPIQFTVDVSGAVDHPGDIQVNEGDRLSIAVAKAGDSQAAHADLNHIRLIRTGPDGKPTTTEINLYKALQGGDESVDVVLHKGDVVYVPEAYQHRSDWGATGGTGLLYILSRILIP